MGEKNLAENRARYQPNRPAALLQRVKPIVGVRSVALGQQTLPYLEYSPVPAHSIANDTLKTARLAEAA